MERAGGHWGAETHRALRAGRGAESTFLNAAALTGFFPTVVDISLLDKQNIHSVSHLDRHTSLTMISRL